MFTSQRASRAFAVLLALAVASIADALQVDAGNHNSRNATASINSSNDFLRRARESPRPVPVWIHIGRPMTDFAAWVFEPIVSTLREAFGSFGLQVKVRYADDNCRVLREVAESSRSGVTPIAVSICSHLILDLKGAACTYEGTWSQLARTGAYLIVYNSEAQPDWKRETIARAFSWQAREIWDYSKYVMSTYENLVPANMLVRFMPPGCAAGLNFGVQLGASARDESRAGFLGNWVTRSPQHRNWYINRFGPYLMNKDDAWSPGPTREFLEQFPIQLNIHSSDWNSPSDGALEPFRFALLVSNKACVLSEPGHPLDMEVWDGIVRFETRENMRNAFASLQNNHREIQTCQEEKHALFCQRFQPSTLLQNSGFINVMQTLQQGSIVQAR